MTLNSARETEFDLLRVAIEKMKTIVAFLKTDCWMKYENLASVE